MVAGAVGALPAELRHGRELFCVLFRIQVAGQADATDDQLAGLAPAHRLVVLIDDCQIPATQGSTDGNRAHPIHGGAAGHDGGLGRAVGVPQFAGISGQTGGQLGRACLAAEDQQAHGIQGLVRPQSGQGRHGGHGGHAAGNQPGAQVHAGAHQGARGGHQTGAVAPGQPHFLAGSVEGYGQASQHAVARSQGLVLQEHLRLRVHKSGRVAVGNGHALGLAGGTRGEDDPRVGLQVGAERLVGACPSAGLQVVVDYPQPIGTVNCGHAGLAEDKGGAFFWIVGVHRYIGSTDGEGGQNSDVERTITAGHANADAVAAPEAALVQPLGGLVDLIEKLGIGNNPLTVVDGGGFRACRSRRTHNIDERARLRCLTGTEVPGRDAHFLARPPRSR